MKSHVTNLAIHPSAKHLIDSYVAHPSQGLLLSGPVGIGTATVAQSLATALHARPDDIHWIRPDDKQTISIDVIRPLYRLSRTVYDSPRVIIIDDAESMGSPAQNALLKLLEEPTEQTYFILTSHEPQLLLTTITSRVQRIELRPVNEVLSKQLLTKQGTDPAAQTKMLFMAQGLPAELTRLSADGEYFAAQAVIVTTARTLLQSGQYDRLVAIRDIKTRPQALELVTMIGQLLEFSILRQKRTDLADALDVIETVNARLYANGNVKIQLTYLVSRLP